MAERLCIFRLGPHDFGLPVTRIQEVLRHSPLTPVPLAPPFVHGLMNMRGQVLPVVEFRDLFGYGPRPAEAPPFHVIVRSADGLVSFMVDSVGDVYEVADGSLEMIPETIQGAARELTAGAFLRDAKMTIALDLDAVLRRVFEAEAK